MRTTYHQLAQAVCESIAHTTPRFRPPSRASQTFRDLVGWVVVIAFLLLIAALLSAMGG